MLLGFILSLFILTFIFISVITASLYIHKNMRGTKLWNFVNTHIMCDEDEYLKNK